MENCKNINIYDNNVNSDQWDVQFINKHSDQVEILSERFFQATGLEKQQSQQEIIFDQNPNDFDFDDDCILSTNQSSISNTSVLGDEINDDIKQRWDKLETSKFFSLLSLYGKHFSEIQKHFPERSHASIKKKFKLELKRNKILIMSILQGEFGSSEQIFNYLQLQKRKNNKLNTILSQIDEI